MSLLTIVAVLLIVGAALYFVNSGGVPIDAKVKLLINAVVMIALIIWLADGFIAHDLYIGRPQGRR